MQSAGFLKFLAVAQLLWAAAVLAQDPAGQGAAEAPAEAAEEEPGADNTYWIYTHAVLMSLGWVALLPLGALLAQSRWLASLKKRVTGTALIIAAFGIAYSDSTHMEPEKEETLGYSHKVIGSIAFGFLLLQVVGGIVRPNPAARIRGTWNIVHHNAGRLAVLLAWVNIWLGVAFWHQDGEMTNGLLAWVVPLAVFQGLLLIAYLVGMLRKPRGAPAAEEEEKQTAYAATATEDGLASTNGATPVVQPAWA
ncbi:hypothetical protein OEZ86_003614 [Tetradesmus obliquus]|nr:hypothetical protein OEZ86_003614 [Tetradesmus obliquus]